MKAKMKNNLILHYMLSQELKGELQAVHKMWGWQEYVNTKIFLKSIEGKVVDLVFTCGDAFEKNDNNIFLPKSLFQLQGVE